MTSCRLMPMLRWLPSLPATHRHDISKPQRRAKSVTCALTPPFYGLRRCLPEGPRLDFGGGPSAAAYGAARGPGCGSGASPTGMASGSAEGTRTTSLERAAMNLSLGARVEDPTLRLLRLASLFIQFGIKRLSRGFVFESSCMAFTVRCCEPRELLCT